MTGKQKGQPFELRIAIAATTSIDEHGLFPDNLASPAACKIVCDPENAYPRFTSARTWPAILLAGAGEMGEQGSHRRTRGQ